MCRCKQPVVRIADSGRVFCATCRQYLDRSQTASEPLRDEEDPKSGIASGDANGSASTDSTSPVDNTAPDAR